MKCFPSLHFIYILYLAGLNCIIPTSVIADDAANHPSLANLPPQEQAAWRRYSNRSDDWRRIDDAFIKKELNTVQLAKPLETRYAKQFGFEPSKPTEWYATPAGQKIADIIVSYQTPSGGWSKRTDMSEHLRNLGEAFGVEDSYIPTFDNDATTTQLRIMAQAYTATNQEKYKNAFLKGLYLILDAQSPNGGWPQNFPLTGGYHDYITYNDETMANILSLLRDVAAHDPLYTFVPEIFRRKSASALENGLNCVLRTQIIVKGKKTAWAGQHDTFTLAPQSARAFEMVAIASRESADLLNFLMTLNHPSADIIEAIESAIDWLKKVQIMGYRWGLNLGVSSTWVAEPDAGPVWARFYEIGSNRPLFGDRDGSVHYHISEISQERQIQYGWYTYEPLKTLELYETWLQNR